MGQAPAAIMRLNSVLQSRSDRPRSYAFLGCVGDRSHSFGYHLSRNDLVSLGAAGSDYSLQLSRDVNGAHVLPDDASAWDLGFNPQEMILVTNRLIAAAQARDPRIVQAVREFCGTSNGQTPHPYDVSSNFDDPNNTEGWDSSHVTHVHISFYRDVCNNWNVLSSILDIICGSTNPTPSPTPTPTLQEDDMFEMVYVPGSPGQPNYVWNGNGLFYQVPDDKSAQGLQASKLCVGRRGVDQATFEAIKSLAAAGH